MPIHAQFGLALKTDGRITGDSAEFDQTIFALIRAINSKEWASGFLPRIPLLLSAFELGG
jgi:hypothetical protein